MQDGAGEPRVRWLDGRERAAWIGLQRMLARLTGRLNHALTADAALSLQDFRVLAALAEAEDGRMRAFELARALGWEKSRLSHHIVRMIDRRLVTREKPVGDERGREVAITALGEAALRRATPTLLEALTCCLFDRLSAEQLETLVEVAAVVAGAVPQEGASDLGE